MSWGRWFSICTIECICWRWLSVPKGWSLWKPSSRLKKISLLNKWILSTFLISCLNRLGVTWGHMAPLSSLRFPRGWFFIFPPRSWINAGTFGARSPFRNPPTVTPVGTGILVVPPWQYILLLLRPWQCIFWKVLGFVRTIQFGVIDFGQSPLLVCNCQGCPMAQMRSPYMTYSPPLSLLVWGVRTGVL